MNAKYWIDANPGADVVYTQYDICKIVINYHDICKIVINYQEMPMVSRHPKNWKTFIEKHKLIKNN